MWTKFIFANVIETVQNIQSDRQTSFKVLVPWWFMENVLSCKTSPFIKILCDRFDLFWRVYLPDKWGCVYYVLHNALLHRVIMHYVRRRKMFKLLMWIMLCKCEVKRFYWVLTRGLSVPSEAPCSQSKLNNLLTKWCL